MYHQKWANDNITLNNLHTLYTTLRFHYSISYFHGYCALADITAALFNTVS